MRTTTENQGPSWDGVHIAAGVILFLLVVLALSFNGGCAAPEVKASKVALQGAGGGVSVEVAGPLDREQAIEALRAAAKPWATCAEYEVQLGEVSARAVPAKGESEATVLTSVRGWFTCASPR